MNDFPEKLNYLNRRQFLTRSSLSLGAAALSMMGNPGRLLANNPSAGHGGILGKLHFPAKAKRGIYLFQSGGPSQFELWDNKTMLDQMHGQELPDSVRQGQRLTGMSSNQSSFPLTRSIYDFKQYGESGTWVSELMPHTAKIADELCFIHSLHTEAINHDPAITFFQTGHQLAGRPSIGAWLDYGLGTDNQDLPSFVVMVSKNAGGQPLYAKLWGNGFLSSKHQGVQFRAGAEPVLYLNPPPGLDDHDRGQIIDYMKQLNELQHDSWGDPEIHSRIAQYEMAYRTQMSVPEVTDASDESESTFELYGEDARDPGTYAANCLMARRLIEKDVKFVQLYHQGWDQHSNLPNGIKSQAKKTDQASAALITDLKQRGLLDDTLVIWGGEFGRTNYSQGKLTADNYGRDHHPRCFTMWMAGAGVKPGYHYGQTDEFGYNITENPVHVHDFQATLMHLLGIDHKRLTYKHQGRRYRLTDVHGHVVKDILS